MGISAQHESATCEHYWVAEHTPGVKIWTHRCFICGTYSPERMNAEVDAVVAEVLRFVTRDPAFRLSGHSGISITRLRTFAAALDGDR